MAVDVSILLRSYPDRFRADRAQAVKAMIHFDLSGEGARAFSVEVSNGNCHVYKSLQGQPDCVIKANVADFIAVETGQIPAQTAFLQGLIKVTDPAVMLTFAKCFRPWHKTVKRSETVSAKKGPDFSRTDRKPQSGPLVGLKILDLSRLAPGPLASMLMAEMGAEVIKIEDPEEGDYVRDYPPRIAYADGSGDESAYYLALNRSKKSLLLNTRSKEGREVFLRLVASADVVLESFRPGVLDSQGIGYKDARARNKGIIYVSITGYGQTGPYSQKAGHDLNYAGYAGVLSVQGDGRGNPAQPGVQMADFAGGSYSAVAATLAAVYSRSQSGEGQHVDVSMTDSVMPLLTLPMAGYLANTQKPVRDQMPLAGGYANYGIYETSDGRHMVLGALEPKFWAAFCEAAGVSEWKGRLSSDSQDAALLKKDLKELFASRNQETWIELAEGTDCCLSPLLELDQLHEDPNLQHRGMLHEFDQTRFGKLKGMGSPWKFSSSEAKPSWPAPKAGADSAAVLREAGLTEEEIRELAYGKTIDFT